MSEAWEEERMSNLGCESVSDLLNLIEHREVHVVIHSNGLIPEVELFLTIEEAREYWADAFVDGDEDDDGKSPEDSFALGFASFGECELRYDKQLLKVAA